ncbi:type IV pilus modification protein PilV [Congregibacter brevis]|uniref:Type IV pilus modification protein PilV n=1 Tax=Congregibacter brevis TaxID=3081201 RepID=A0ABZ0IAV0_9GAMM|nr:type IV pilus modification protein PilV [Congregibacter sp. IMCC45268]
MNSSRQQAGFTLIEVMVSVLILLVGLLGVVGMQMLSLQANQGAYFRSQAVYIGAEILDAMRANPTAAASYVGVYPDDGAGTSTVPADQSCDDADGCTPQEAAQQDIREWNVHFFDVLGVGAGNFRPSIPNGRAVITATGNQYTVTVNWTERQFDDTDNTDGSDTRSRVQQVVNLTAALTP